VDMVDCLEVIYLADLSVEPGQHVLTGIDAVKR
jgi:hypothetical protein